MQDILDFVKGRLDHYQYEKFIYVLESGKRVRPNLMESVCQTIGKDFEPLAAAAAAIEVMHCVSLVHDDIIDSDEERREKPSFYKKFGTNSAVLFGDLFAVMATQILAENYRREIYVEFIKTFKLMIEGQIMELEGRVNSMESYFEYTTKKTVSLFELCAKIPLMHYNVEDEMILEFVREFGSAFQIMNDLSGKDGEMSITNFMSRDSAAQIAGAKIERMMSLGLPEMEKSIEILRKRQ